MFNNFSVILFATASVMTVAGMRRDFRHMNMQPEVSSCEYSKPCQITQFSTSELMRQIKDQAKYFEIIEFVKYDANLAIILAAFCFMWGLIHISLGLLKFFLAQLVKLNISFNINSHLMSGYSSTDQNIKGLERISSPKIIQESAVIGSEYERKQAPKFQIAVYVQDPISQEMVSVGQSFRVVNYLITAKHVVENHSTIYLRALEGSFIPILVESFIFKSHDTAFVELPLSYWSKLGAASSKLHKSIISNTTVHIAAHGEGTIGSLKPLTSGFGSVIYGGSTKPGFSGAPYYVGNVVLGMHTNGGTINAGVSSAIIAAILTNFVRPEDTDDSTIRRLIADAQRTGNKIQARRHHSDWNDLYVSHGKGYTIVDLRDYPELERYITEESIDLMAQYFTNAEESVRLTRDDLNVSYPDQDFLFNADVRELGQNQPGNVRLESTFLKKKTPPLKQSLDPKINIVGLQSEVAMLKEVLLSIQQSLIASKPDSLPTTTKLSQASSSV